MKRHKTTPGTGDWLEMATRNDPETAEGEGVYNLLDFRRGGLPSVPKKQKSPLNKRSSGYVIIIFSLPLPPTFRHNQQPKANTEPIKWNGKRTSNGQQHDGASP